MLRGNLNEGRKRDEPDVADMVRKRVEDIALPAESFARVVAFAISHPDEMDVNEILFRPTRQAL
jgi:NADP-dependent 3-hydroxy acid dehydrogenase YdfG